MTEPDGEAEAGDGQIGGYSRRRLLAGLTTVGASGALVGGGLGVAFDDQPAASNELGTVSDGSSLEGFWDTEISGNLNANVLQAGKLDLTTCWERPGTDCTPASDTSTLTFDSISPGETLTATLRCDIADNPGWLWLRTGCPEDACALERDVKLTVWYDENCDGAFESKRVLTANDGTKIENVRLCDALTKLRGGVQLDGDLSTDAPDPLDPSDTCCLGFEFSVDEFVCAPDGDELTFDVDLFATQRRHNPDPTPPDWTADCTVDCNADCPSCDFQGISFVAFCIEEGTIERGDITFTPYFDSEGEPFKLDWQSDVPLEWVVLFYGSKDGKFFENFHVNGDTAGSVQVNSPAHESRLEWGGGTDVTTYGQCPRDPCPNLGLDTGAGKPWCTADEYYGCGVKYNFDDQVWDGPCGNPCKSEGSDCGGGS